MSIPHKSDIKRSRVLDVILLLVYFTLVVLPHNFIGGLIGRNLGKPLGRANYNLLILSLGVLVVIIGTIYFRKFYMELHHHQKLKFILYAFLTACLVILSFNVLLVVNIEIVHFIQYAVLALLLFKVLGSYAAVMCWGTLFGFVDEFYQYLILSPTSDYFDFNDVFIDQIGLAIGLLVLYLYKREESQLTIFSKKPFLIGMILTLGVLIACFMAVGYLSFVPDDNAFLELIRKDKEGFWRTVPPQVTFHVMRPLEGFLCVLLMIALYWPFKYKPLSS